MNDKKLKEFAKKYRAYFAKVVSVEFINRKNPPLLFLDWASNASYTDHTEIHIGLQMFRLYAKDEHDLFWMTMYVLRHEMQHVKSTVQRDWANAQKIGMREVCLSLAGTSLGGKVRLLKDSDYQRLMEALNRKGICVSMQHISDLVHYVCNSVEDGRIENIAAAKNHVFESSRRAFRGMMWLADECEMPEEDKLDANMRLGLVLNQVLNVATSGVYEKGFLDAYEGRDLHRKVRKVTPMIRQGVAARTCREGMKSATDIIRELAPDIAEAAKAPEDFAKLLDLIRSILKESGADSFSASNEDEEKGTGESVPVLEDAEESSESESSENGNNDNESSQEDEFQKSEADAESGQNATGDADGSEDNAGDKGQDSDAQEGNAESQNEGELADQTDQAENASEAGNSVPDDAADENGEQSAEESQPQKKAENKADPEKGETDSRQSSESSEKADLEAARKAVEEAMQEAAEGMKTYEEMAEEVQKEEERLQKDAEKFRHPKASAVPDVSSSYSYNVDFSEVTRKYTPDIMPPADIVSRGSMMRRSIEKVLKQKRQPDQRGMRSGRIDSSRLSGLIFSDTKCFKRLGEKKKPDCAVFLLGDNSGSMAGSGRFYCLRSFAVVEEAFRGLAKMKIAVFDSYGTESVTHEVVKDFDEEFAGSFSCSFLEYGRTGYGNKDGYSIRVAAKQLLARPEEDKILLIASDGLPSDYDHGYSEGICDVKSAVQEARKAGITVIGMYMNDYDDDSEEFEEMYAPHAVVTPFEEMPETLALVLKNAFLKR